MDIRVGLQDAPSKVEGTSLEMCYVRFFSWHLADNFLCRPFCWASLRGRQLLLWLDQNMKGNQEVLPRLHSAKSRLRRVWVCDTPKDHGAFSFWIGWRGGPERQATAWNWRLNFSASAQPVSHFDIAIALWKSCDLHWRSFWEDSWCRNEWMMPRLNFPRCSRDGCQQRTLQLW